MGSSEDLSRFTLAIQVEVTIDTVSHADVEASYTLKSDENINEIHLQLPFMENPNLLKIYADEQLVPYEITPYYHVMNGYLRTYKMVMKRPVKEWEKVEDHTLEMKSAVFTLDATSKKKVTFKATYQREISYFDTVRLGKMAEYEAIVAPSRKRRARSKYAVQYYKDIAGDLYNYTYLFQTGLTWPKPIERVELIIKIKENLFQKVITEKELKNRKKDGRREISNSADSLSLFNEDGLRQTTLLTRSVVESGYRVFRFERVNWTPTQNAGIIWLGKEPQSKK